MATAPTSPDNFSVPHDTFPAANQPGFSVIPVADGTGVGAFAAQQPTVLEI